MKAVRIILAFALALPLSAQDAKKWAEAVGYFQRFSSAKDAADRTAAVKGLGDATTEKTDKMCWQLTSAALRQELGRENDGKNEEKVSGMVLDACVETLRKITKKEVVEEIAKAAKNKGDTPRFRAHLVWGLSAHGDLKEITEQIDAKTPHVQIAAID